MKEQRLSNKKKLRLVYRISGIYFAILFAITILPPFVRLWDRNDIWILGVPLSQFTAIFSTFLLLIGMCVLYYFDKKYTNKSVESTGNTRKLDT